MKLKSLLLATLLFAALAVSASAQQKAVERRQSDSFQGPVKSVRIEQATFRRVGGEPVETPRRLISFVNYAPDGKSREVVDYAPDGSVQYRYTYFYDDEGRDVETSQFDASDHLLRRSVYIPQAGEELVYNGDGSLRERSVLVWGYDGRRVGTMVYDGAGALKERHVGTREGGLSVWSVYRPDGTLKRRDTNTPNNGGPAAPCCRPTARTVRSSAAKSWTGTPRRPNSASSWRWGATRRKSRHVRRASSTRTRI